MVRPLVDISDFAQRSAVYSHPHWYRAVIFERFADFERTPDWRLQSVAENQRHAVPCGKPYQHTARLRIAELRCRPHDFIERFQSLALLVDEQL